MYYIGVDLGGTNIAIGLVNEDLKIVDKGSVPTKADRDAELIIKDMAELTAHILQRNQLTVDDVAYVGIASPGIANSDDGVIEYANNLPFLHFPVVKVFQKYLPIKTIYVENDANAAAVGEAIAGSAKGAKNSLMITLGTGVGGGILINGKVYSGFNHAGAELGHMIIVKDGKLCSCGRRGCFEAYCSATALIKQTEEKITECKIKSIPTLLNDEVAANNGRVSARTAFNAQKRGDPVAIELVNQYISYLACGITNLINIFQPSILSIGGGVSGEKNNLLNPLISLISREQYSRDLEHHLQTKIVIATLGNDAGIIGAACLGMQD
ncbi:MAG: ROK family protein [Clostridia bacterium]|nr:ROK family protein [Clostridia bacterium]